MTPQPLRVRVLLQEPVGLLDYGLPAPWADAVTVGTPVRVPLGRRITSAYVTALPTEPWPEGTPLRDVAALDDDRPHLPAAIIEMLLFAAQHYRVPPGEMLGAALPAMARGKTMAYRLTDRGLNEALGPRASAAQQAVVALGREHPKGFTLAAVQRATNQRRTQGAALLRRLKEQGLIEEATRAQGKARVVWAFSRVPQLEDTEAPIFGARQVRQQRLYDAMAPGVPLSLEAIRTIDPKPAAPLRALIKQGLVSRHAASPETLSGTRPPKVTASPFVATPQQAKALAHLREAIDAGVFAPHLLHGVTGSGKTEVYLQAIEHVLSLGKTALVLVPEIALTPQLGERFRQRFGPRVATFHSGLTVAQRRDEWLRVANNEAVIGLGARSALFLPLEKLGIIVVDEEHETSFKQDESPRYHARDLAVWRAQQAQAVIVLGSATPSLESYHNSELGRYRRLEMPDRVQSRPLPDVQVVPLAQTAKVGSGALTEPLAQAVAQTLNRGEQVILFLNRRGFAPYIFCRDCGHSFRCDDCEVSLTLHRARNLMMCHYCGFTLPAPDVCPGCQGHEVGAFGLGTEQLEDEVRALFGEVPLVRLDRDTIRKRSELEAGLGRFRRNEARILIGTQMVAKGHDFPGVTLVGVLNADASLNFPDFRAAERTFQLLTQVAGRAGRGELRGHVLVQAYEPEHYAIVAAQNHDYHAFIEAELEHRRELYYPPFAYLVLVRYESPSDRAAEALATREARAWEARLAAIDAALELLGPAPAPLAKLRGAYRFHLVLKAPSRRAVYHALAALPAPSTSEAGHPVRRIIDIDPVSML